MTVARHTGADDDFRRYLDEKFVNLSTRMNEKFSELSREVTRNRRDLIKRADSHSARIHVLESAVESTHDDMEAMKTTLIQDIVKVEIEASQSRVLNRLFLEVRLVAIGGVIGAALWLGTAREFLSHWISGIFGL